MAVNLCEILEPDFYTKSIVDPNDIVYIQITRYRYWRNITVVLHNLQYSFSSQKPIDDLIRDLRAIKKLNYHHNEGGEYYFLNYDKITSAVIDNNVDRHTIAVHIIRSNQRRSVLYLKRTNRAEAALKRYFAAKKKIKGDSKL